MRIQTALNHRSRAARQLGDLYSKARIFRLTSSELNRQSIEIRETCSKCPTWVTAYLEGMESVLRDGLYHNDLEYCSYIDGQIVSHHSASERYYEKQGFTPGDVCQRNNTSGHYWKDTDRPFFLAPN